MPIIKSVRNCTPLLGADCYLADNAVVVGEVIMGDRCTVWFNAVIRGDVHSITIGDDTNIQDGAIIHATYKTASTTIGSKVSIAHNAIVHGCVIEDRVLIGMGAIVMDHAHIGEGSVIAAGAVVLPGTKVPAGKIYGGMPARELKDTGPEMLEVIERTARNYPMYAGWYTE
ncbi:gamma carbonic anhydrase family protein [Fulvivirga sedimenti]|uniref:Gamma carbonic anhydrase family protein n=1 Tax=Fulvivirga sedimenti TaxID=2879465 RepID=A0A9X1HMK3_9BACT|nr:gamma carbonic anhydrase family protein [Fulvivirga sedimenti]MCA6073347.1 gamma carbonic anhydrase family protein [Fulvivirga sedimenti]